MARTTDTIYLSLLNLRDRLPAGVARSQMQEAINGYATDKDIRRAMRERLAGAEDVEEFVLRMLPEDTADEAGQADELWAAVSALGGDVLGMSVEEFGVREAPAAASSEAAPEEVVDTSDVAVVDVNPYEGEPPPSPAPRPPARLRRRQAEAAVAEEDLAEVTLDQDVDFELGSAADALSLGMEDRWLDEDAGLERLRAKEDLGMALTFEEQQLLVDDEVGATLDSLERSRQDPLGSAGANFQTIFDEDVPQPEPQPEPQPDTSGTLNSRMLGAAIVGGTGLAAGLAQPFVDQYMQRDWENMLRASADGDTVARKEGALAAGRAMQGMMGASLGRRDISPALAMRNAQNASRNILQDIYGRQLVASAQERRIAEQQLAKIRSDRWQKALGTLTQVGADVGAFLGKEGAKQSAGPVTAGMKNSGGGGGDATGQ